MCEVIEVKNKFIILILFLISFFTLCGCNSNSSTEPPTDTPIIDDNHHYHSYNTVWQSDDISHWYECDCGRKVRNQEHIWDAGLVTTKASELSSGVKIYTCQVCGEKYERELKYMEIKKISILGIGNSFTVDSMWLLYDVLKSLGYDEIELGILFIGSSSLADHYSNIRDNVSAYEYFFNNTGTYYSSGSSILSALEERNWDYVICSQLSEYTATGNFARLNEVVNFVKDNQPDTTKVYWNVTWGHSSTTIYGSDYSAMYLDCMKAAQTYLVPKKNLDYLMPTGTAVQNYRVAAGVNLMRDKLHLTYDLGRFIAALSVAKSISGLDISNVWYPDTVTTEQCELAIKAVNAAHINNYTVTDILG